MSGRRSFANELLLMVPTDIKTSTLHPGKVSCEYCAGYSKMPWFLAKNLPQHLKCASHLKSANEERARQETKEILDRLRAQDLERLQQSGHQYAPLSHLERPEAPVPTKLPLDIGEQQMWDDFELDRSNALLLDVGSADQFNPMEQHEVEFYRIMDRAEMDSDLTGWGFKEFDAERDVDETLTNVMQSFGESRKGFRTLESGEAYNLVRFQRSTCRGQRSH